MLSLPGLIPFTSHLMGSGPKLAFLLTFIIMPGDRNYLRATVEGAEAWNCAPQVLALRCVSSLSAVPVCAWPRHLFHLFTWRLREVKVNCLWKRQSRDLTRSLDGLQRPCPTAGKLPTHHL